MERSLTTMSHERGYFIWEMTKTHYSIWLLVLLAIVTSVHAQELVKDIRPGMEGSHPRALVQVGKRFFFQARTTESGIELWTSDGSSAGTQMVMDIAPGEASSRAEPLVAILDTLFFNTVEPGAFWRTDGTEAGTLKLAEFGSGSARHAWVVGSLVFFKVSPGNGSQLWYTDGTASATRRITEFGVGQTVPDNINDVVIFRGSLYFTASHGGNNSALWKIESPNTTPEEIFSVELTQPLYLQASSNHLYILGADTQVVHSLWVSDGSLSGTTKIAEFTGGTHASDAWFIGSDDEHVYFSPNDGTHGYEPWVSDGTPNGTRLLKDIVPGEDRSYFWDGIAYDGGFFFATSNDEYGSELWITDGSPEGTRLFVDINPGPDGSGVNGLVRVNDGIVFTATDGVHGRELWQTTGTPNQTEMIRDLNPGSDDSDPRDVVLIGDFLYFSAIHADYGRELWKLALSNTILIANNRDHEIPNDLTVSSPFPNPFWTETTLRYEIPAGAVQIILYNVLGEKVRTLFSGHQGPGPHHVSVGASNLVSGIYFVQIQTSSSLKTRKLVLVR